MESEKFINHIEANEDIHEIPSLEVYLIRHAKTGHDKSDPNRELTEVGIRQVEDSVNEVLDSLLQERKDELTAFDLYNPEERKQVLAFIAPHLHFRIYDSGTVRTKEQSNLQKEFLVNAGIPPKNIYLPHDTDEIGQTAGPGTPERLSVSGLEGNYPFRQQRETTEYQELVGAKDGMVAWLLTPEENLPEGVETGSEISGRTEKSIEALQKLALRLSREEGANDTTVVLANSHAPFVMVGVGKALGLKDEEMFLTENAEGVRLVFNRDATHRAEPFGPKIEERITAIKAEDSGISAEDFHAVKAIGSTVGPYNEAGMGRALETADIYAHEIAGDEAFRTAQSEVLSYDRLVTPVPYNHREVYNANLPENFDHLNPEDKAEAAKRAQQAVINHVLALDTPEAWEYKKEAAGSFAYVIEHYRKVAHRLKSQSRVLIPAGCHGVFMELLMQQALIRKDGEGNETRGFSTLEEIGGQQDTSEAFNVDISTNDEGRDRPFRVSFFDTKRPTGEMYLDEETVKDLADYYAQLHPNLRQLRITEEETNEA